MKIGDKVYCKKNYYIRGKYDPPFAWFKEGRFYIITDVDDVSLLIKNNIGDRIYFFIYKNYNGESNFFEYFCTNKEYRKMKLERLNDNL